MKSATEQHAISLQELGGILIKHLKIKEGRFQIRMGFRIGVGAIPGPDNITLPGAMVGVESVLLTRVGDEFDGPNVVDAQEDKPIKTPRTSKKQS